MSVKFEIALLYMMHQTQFHFAMSAYVLAIKTIFPISMQFGKKSLPQ